MVEIDCVLTEELYRSVAGGTEESDVERVRVAVLRVEI